MGPFSSHKRVSEKPTPSFVAMVCASRQIHSPFGRRSSVTVRSALMKVKRLKSTACATPLPESAAITVRTKGEGFSPGSSGSFILIHAATGLVPSEPRAKRPSIEVWYPTGT